MSGSLQRGHESRMSPSGNHFKLTDILKERRTDKRQLPCEPKYNRRRTQMQDALTSKYQKFVFVSHQLKGQTAYTNVASLTLDAIASLGRVREAYQLAR